MASKCDVLLTLGQYLFTVHLARPTLALSNLIGTSLQVFSAFRLAKAAKKSGATLIAVNVGATRADQLLDRKVESLAGETAMRLATHKHLLDIKIL